MQFSPIQGEKYFRNKQRRMIIVFQDKIEWKERKNKLRTACGACRDFYVLCAEAFSVVLVHNAECGLRTPACKSPSSSA